MRKTDATGNFAAVLLDMKTFQKYINAGRQTADMIAKESGAIRRFGKTVRYYRPAIDEYLKKGSEGKVIFSENGKIRH